ncbi:MAG: DNA repair protein RadA [Clostridia bacterium]|nr:DNA repair protein RadA [Clostridia bacterium]
MKTKTVFVCSNCGAEQSRWVGKCPACNEWNTLNEEVRSAEKTKTASARVATPATQRVLPITQIESREEERTKTRIGELDRVLGGGIVKGSLVLIGGDPGIGKSTLLLQICGQLASAEKMLYVSGEESPKQIKLRANRLSVASDNLLLLSETDIDTVLETALQLKPDYLMIDSVQTMYTERLTGAPGSVGQVREVTLSLMKYAKESGVPVFVVGHVTKDGAIAGPKVLEHMVDCVLYFEGDRHQTFRILRSVKNRFGSTNEIGVFEMQEEGLIEVPNPSALFLTDRPEDISGSCVLATMEGTRPILAEIQALLSPTAFGLPRRTANGVDYNRVIMLMAVLEKRAGLNLSGQDAYINVIGGLRLDEPAADLGLVLAIASNFKNKPLSPKLAAFGEVGLTGEIRAVSQAERRVLEAAKLGFETIILPHNNLRSLKNVEGVKVIGVRNLFDALKVALG